MLLYEFNYPQIGNSFPYGITYQILRVNLRIAWKQDTKSILTLCVFGTVVLIRWHSKTKVTVRVSGGGPLVTRKLTRRGCVRFSRVTLVLEVKCVSV
jgi:hypothetical protein